MHPTPAILAATSFPRLLPALLLVTLTHAIRAQAPAPLPSVTETTTSEQLRTTDAHLRTYLQSHDSDAGAHYLLAYTLFREQKAADSLSEYTRAASLRPPTPKDLGTVALDYVLLNDYSDADHWMTRSLDGRPQDAEAWYQLGRIKYTENRFAESIQAFEKSLSLLPRSVKAENNLGLALEGINRTDDAIAAYRQAIAWQVQSEAPSEQPLLNLAIVLTDREQPQQALDLLLQAGRIAPRDAKISEQLGRAYSKLGRLPEAQAALEKAAALTPGVPGIHFELGQVYRKEGLAPQAKAAFARAASLNAAQTTPANPSQKK